MYKIKNDFIGCTVENLQTHGIIYLNNATTQEVLQVLFNEGHPAVEFIEEIKPKKP